MSQFADRLERATACPKCGGALILRDHYTYSLDFRITKKGVLSKTFTKGEPGAIDCMTAFCCKCNSCWDAEHVVVENDRSVYLKKQ